MVELEQTGNGDTVFGLSLPVTEGDSILHLLTLRFLQVMQFTFESVFYNA